MKYRYLGKTGLIISRVCLGTMTFGMKDWGCDGKTSIQLVDMYLDAGGNFIDTADVYSGGASEEIVGEALKSKKRDDIVLATKFCFRTGTSPNAKGLSRKHIFEACEASLRRLKTDHVDLYFIHGPDPFTRWEETMRALNDLVHQGKVRYLGCSNIFAWQILKANGISAQQNLEKLVCGEYMYNLIHREVEREILPACEDQGMGFLCWSPVAAGMLTGKYQKGEKPTQEGTRIYHRSQVEAPRYWHDRGFEMAKKVSELSKKVGIPPAQLALSWLLHDKRVTAVITGAKKIEQLKDNLVVGGWDLPAEVWEEVDKETSYDLGFLVRFANDACKSTFTFEGLDRV